jgi:hypothetical protein
MAVTEWSFLQALGMPARRFPPPWTVEELNACFVVRNHNGQAPETISDVRYWRQSGHHSDVRRCPLLTQSGHGRLMIAAVQTDP